jgi:hypothetical protein
VTFAVHREGPNLGLLLAPVGLSFLKDALELPPDDRALVLDPSVNGRHFAVPWSAIDQFRPDVDLVHLPAGADVGDIELPVPLLARPDEAVPVDRGSLAAVSLHDGCHGAVLAREPEVVERCLAAFVEEYIVAVLSRDAKLPSLSEEVLATVLEPLPDGCWYDLAFHAGRRIWTLEATLQDDDGPAPPIRWVCEGEQGRWRAGWSW